MPCFSRISFGMTIQPFFDTVTIVAIFITSVTPIYIQYIRFSHLYNHALRRAARPLQLLIPGRRLAYRGDGAAGVRAGVPVAGADGPRRAARGDGVRAVRAGVGAEADNGRGDNAGPGQEHGRSRVSPDAAVRDAAR